MQNLTNVPKNIVVIVTSGWLPRHIPKYKCVAAYTSVVGITYSVYLHFKLVCQF